VAGDGQRIVTGVLCAVAGSTAGGLTLSVSPLGVSATSGASQTMSTNSATVGVIAGGSGAYTYAWTVFDVVGMAGCSAVAPTAATTNFFCDTVEGANSGSATGTCLVTDTGSGKTASIQIPISASFTGTPP
jgi:hypothetical protein